MTLRARTLTILRSSVGLSAAPSKLDDFGNLMGCGEDKPIRVAMATWKSPSGQGVSTCALFLRGVMNEAGVDDPLVRPKYVAGTAFSTVEHVATKRGALRKPGGGALPKGGDFVAVGALTPMGHMFGVESVTLNADGTVTVMGIEGGQVSKAKATAPDDPGGAQMVARKRHTWTPDGKGGWTDKAVIVEPAGWDGYTARPVSWWVDIDAIEAGGPITDRDDKPENVVAQRGDDRSAITSDADPLPSVTLRRGASGAAVRRWQAVIGVAADGQFGPATEAATKDWQARHGLQPDGVVGARSWATAISAGQPAPAAPPTRPEAPSVAVDAELGTLPQVPGLLERERLEPGFCRALLAVLRGAGANVDRVTALIAEESRFNPAALNPAGGASGLMQWMPFLWSNPVLGPKFRTVAASADALRTMTATQQLELARITLGVWGPKGAQDPALAGWGSNVGSSDDTILATKDRPGRVAFYRDNAGYDRDRDGHITAGEVRAAVYGLLVKAASLPRVGPDGRTR